MENKRWRAHVSCPLRKDFGDATPCFHLQPIDHNLITLPYFCCTSRKCNLHSRELCPDKIHFSGKGRGNMDQIWGQPAVIANLRKGKDANSMKTDRAYSRAYCDEDRSMTKLRAQVREWGDGVLQITVGKQVLFLYLTLKATTRENITKLIMS